MRARAPARGRYPRRFFQREGVPYANVRFRRVSVRGRLQRQSLEFTNVAHERQLGAGSNSGARWHGAAVPRVVHDSYRCSAAFCPRDCRGYPTQLGRFTGIFTADVHPDSTGTGTFNFTAANGDQLSGTTVGQGVFIPPNNARLTNVATIENGTGRFAGATGTFTMIEFDTIDFAPGGKVTGEGTFEGEINLNK